MQRGEELRELSTDLFGVPVRQRVRPLWAERLARDEPRHQEDGFTGERNDLRNGQRDISLA